MQRRLRARPWWLACVRRAMAAHRSATARSLADGWTFPRPPPARVRVSVCVCLCVCVILSACVCALCEGVLVSACLPGGSLYTCMCMCACVCVCVGVLTSSPLSLPAIVIQCPTTSDGVTTWPTSAGGATNVAGTCALGYVGSPVRACSATGQYLQPTGTPCTRTHTHTHPAPLIEALGAQTLHMLTLALQCDCAFLSRSSSPVPRRPTSRTH
jgi:hypothetical protein